MTYRSVAFREFAWCAAALLASVSLSGCPGGGGGGGGCPEISGDWTVNGSCTSASCEITQDGCAITLECSDGRTLEGTVSKSSARFRDTDVSCMGQLEGLEDEDGNGSVNPTLEGDCTVEGEMCDFFAGCVSGDCTVPDEDSGSDEGDSGQGGSSGFLGGGNGGTGGSGGSGPGGEGGDSGESGEGGSGGEGGFSGEGGSQAGVGGSGGSVSGSCGSCIDSACGSERSACDATIECGAVLDCLVDSGCSFDDEGCITNYCQSRLSGLPPLDEADQEAVDTVDQCIAAQCASECVGGGGTGGVGGSGGIGGEGGVGGVPPSGGSGGGTPGCDDSCGLVDDECDDGRPGAITDICAPGTDCTDCGPSAG